MDVDGRRVLKEQITQCSTNEAISLIIKLAFQFNLFFFFFLLATDYCDCVTTLGATSCDVQYLSINTTWDSTRLLILLYDSRVHIFVDHSRPRADSPCSDLYTMLYTQREFAISRRPLLKSSSSSSCDLICVFESTKRGAIKRKEKGFFHSAGGHCRESR